ncbi:MAG: hypothetical protein WAK18_18310 [Nocardioidaceae bacterium]
MSTDVTTTALAVASALHAGFQLVVTLVVYPALAETNDRDWAPRHAAHSRRIAPVVVLVYGALVASSVAALLADRRPPMIWTAIAAAVVAMVVTAVVAAPTHGKLGRGRDGQLVHRLLVWDRLRCAAAVVGAAAAFTATW